MIEILYSFDLISPFNAYTRCQTSQSASQTQQVIHWVLDLSCTEGEVQRTAPLLYAMYQQGGPLWGLRNQIELDDP